MSERELNYSDGERRAFEGYLLADSDAARTEAIAKLVPGSHLWYFLYFMDRFRREGGKPLTAEELAHMTQFRSKYWNTNELREIEARLKFLTYDEATSDEDRTRALTDIQQSYLPGFNFNHQKPDDLSKRAGADSESSEAEDGGAFGEKKVYEFDSDKYFSREKALLQVAGNVNDENISRQALDRIPQGFEHTLDFTQYHPKVVYEQFSNNEILGKRVSDLVNPKFWESLGKYFEKEYTTNKHFELSQTLLDRLTLKQLDKLATLHAKVREDKAFIGSYFQKQFAEELSLENQEVWSPEEKRSNLLTLYNYAKSKNMPKSLQASLLIEVLDLGIKVNQYDEKLFREYLEVPIVTQQNVFKQKKGPARIPEVSTTSHWNRYIANVQQSQQRSGAPPQYGGGGNWEPTQTSMVKKYLEYFCQAKNGSLEHFKDDFEATYLKDIEQRVAIYSAEAGEGVTKLIQVQPGNGNDLLKKYQQISAETIVRFLESNPEQFKVEDEVKLALELKNVQTLYIKIFEFNTETYYKKTLQPFNTGVNLDGLIASTERVVEDFKDRPSNKKFQETFKFPELSNKVGLFIVEFIGNGLSARAVIKKGSLSLIHKPTIAGHLAYVLDENKKICLGSTENENLTGIHFDGNFYPAKPDRGGKIFIPYGKSTLNAKAILINNGFAQLCDFERQTERYSFSAWMHLNSESILIGNKASLLIKPALQVNSRQASLSLLKKVKVTLTTTSYIDNLPVTKNFENLTFSDDKDSVLEFQVPPHLGSITATLTCEVYNITQQTSQPFSESQYFQITHYSGSFNMCELFLKKEKNEYSLYVLGKNGEPRPDVKVDATFIHKWFQSQQNHAYNQAQILTTDKDGRVKLGKLRKIVAVKVNVRAFNLNQSWMLANHLNGEVGSTNMLTYPSQVDCVEGETLEFPLSGLKKKSRKALSLIKQWNPQGTQAQSLATSIVLDDLFDSLNVVPGGEDRDYSTVKLPNLQEGVYQLRLKKLSKTINITVHRGQYWDSDSFILKRNCLFENRAPLKMIKLPKVKLAEQEGGNHKVTIRVEDFGPTARLHVFATHYLPNLPTSMFMQVVQKLMEGGAATKTVFPFAQWKNILLSNRELSDEFRYVFDRKYAERALGNTLDRPKLLVKRQFVQTTQIAQEVLRGGQQYQQMDMQYDIQNVQQVQYQSQQIASYDALPQQQQRIAGKAAMMLNNYNPSSYVSDPYAYGGGFDGTEIGYDMLISGASGGSTEMKILELQNFLRTPPLALFNLVPQGDQGEVTFTANLKGYTQLYILAIDQNSVAQRQVDLGHEASQLKRDLSLAKSLSAGGSEDRKGFTESRMKFEVKKGETHVVEDITSTETQLIDDMKKVHGVLEELMRNYSSTSGIFGDLAQLALDWPKKSPVDKCKLAYKHFCHEFNFFLKQRDPEFYESTVRPLLQCKMEKTFVDLYLLDDHQTLLAVYNTLERISALNVFEKCLLLDVLVKTGNHKDAERLTEHIKYLRDYVENNTNIEQQNRIFDIVLNLNMIKADGGPGLGGPPLDGGLDLLGGVMPASNFSLSSLSGEAATGFTFGAANNAQPFNNYAGMNQVAGFLPSQPLMMHQQYQQQQQTMAFGSMARTSNVALHRNNMAMVPQSYTTTSTINRKAYNPNENLFEDDFGGGMEVRNEYEGSKKKAKMAFEEIQSTGEYTETQYYKQTQYSSSKQLIAINSFWSDYAEYLLKRGQIGGASAFLSANFTRNSDNQTSAFLTFALLDLPLGEAEAHQYKVGSGEEGSRSMEIKTSGNVIIFKKVVQEAPLDINNDILVTHRYISATDNQSLTGSQQAVPDEFLLNKAYSCEVILTNVSPTFRSFSVLYQIPQGSLPLQTTKYMKSQQQTLNPYTTQKLIFHFYFPKEGTFAHFPSNVAQDGGKVIARASQISGLPLQLRVVKKFTIAKMETFRDIMASANRNEEVLKFLRTKNLHKGELGFSFSDMLWMLRDKVFFRKALEVLRDRMIYDDNVWSYAMYHKDEELACREYLMATKQYSIQNVLTNSFKSRLYEVNFQDSEFKHLDYFPMVNARAHSVGDLEHWTLNKNFKQTFNRFLKAMSEHAAATRAAKPLSDPAHKLILVQYLQLQDRVTDAINLFKTVPVESLPKDGTLRIQFDYMSAYFDFFTGQDEGFKVARTIVRKYEDYPILAWRIPFLEILDQLNEFDGDVDEEEQKLEGAAVDHENLTEEQKKLKYKKSMKMEPRLTFEISEKEQGVIEIESANVKKVSLKFYIIDAEILFSRTPFLKTNTEEFSYVKPCHVIDKDIEVNPEGDSNTQTIKVQVPENLKLQNMVIEINGEGKQLFRTYYATQIKVLLTEAFGELKVTEKDSAKPLPRVYVKVFAQKKGGSASSPFFFKDGYTDIRGKFDYSQTSGNRLKDVERFAILIMSDTLGSIIKECDPPKSTESDSGNGASDGGMAQQKADRIISRCNAVKQSKK